MKIINKIEELFVNNDYYPYSYIKPLVNIIIENIKNKFAFHYSLSNSFFIEVYIEREWRELYSIHYSKTNYNISNKVTRIHFISDKVSKMTEINDKNYLGYITLRPLPVHNNIISRARLKYFLKQYNIQKQDNVKFNKIQISTTLPHATIAYDTFPYTTQDGVVTVCAHSDILMLSKYMYKKFNFNFLSTSKMLTFINQHNGRKIPNQGLLLEQMIDILNKHDYNPSLFRFEDLKISIETSVKEKYDFDDIFYEEILNTAISSDLPVLFMFENHVVVINGFIEKSDGRLEYILFDDSSYFIKNYFGGNKEYTLNIDSKQIVESIAKCKDNCNNQYAIIPTFDRFYFRYKELYVLIHTKLKNLVIKKIETDVAITYKVALLESKHIVRKYKKYENMILPHYVWYIRWFENGIMVGISIIDATAHKSDNIISLIEDFVAIKELKTYRRT